MIQTTFRELHKTGACKKRYKHLAKALGGIQKYGRDTSITLLQILDINGFDDALWALRACDDAETFSRLLVCDYAEHVLHIFEAEYPDDYRPREVIAVSRRYARGEATDAELSAAWSAAETAARSAGAAWAAAGTAAETAAETAAGAAAWSAAETAAGAAARAAARNAARAAERQWQEARLREMLKEMEAK